HPRARPGGGERDLLRACAPQPPAPRDAARSRAHPRALHPRPLPRAHRQRLRQLRQQRPLPALGARHLASLSVAAARGGRAADGPDHLVHPERPRHLEPEDQQGAGPLRARHGPADEPAAQAGGALAGPGAGALDIAVGPRWYSTYEMACNCITHYLEKQKIAAVPYAGTTAKELALLANSEPLTAPESEALLDAVLNQPEPAYLEHLSRLLL